VKIEMLNQGITITKLADLTGYTRPHLSGVINGKYDSGRAKKVIALALRKDFKELWDNQINSIRQSAG
ncbi:helix-turn-helix domain-containing protein, partial [Thermodesulfobacteriota bacterium]